MRTVRRINWRLKATAFRAFDVLPAGSTIYYLAQRHVTHTLPVGHAALSSQVGVAESQWRSLRAYYRGDIGSARLFEFGAGWDLFNNLVQWCYGINYQLVIDIARWARTDQINHAIRYLQAHPPPRSIRTPEVLMADPFERRLREHYGIEYVAPCDARQLPVGRGEIDLISTTSVLEHIPPTTLVDIMHECHRISSEHTVSSHVIDYTDHYANTDPSISIYNFLRFTDAQWARFNPRLHYQNRLRHFEYRPLFREARFDVRGEETNVPKNADALLSAIPLAGRFREMSVVELAPTAGRWVLQRR
jgi:hypothetical protein